MEQARTANAFEELAVACAYQQRHVLELALKGLISMLHEVADNDIQLSQLKGRAPTSTAPSREERNRLNKEHDLRLLLADLKAALGREAAMGTTYRELPADLDTLVAEFAALEDGQSSRLRYATVRRAGEHVLSFPEEVVIPIVEFQARLEALIDELSGEVQGPSESIARELDDTLHAQWQDLYTAGLL